MSKTAQLIRDRRAVTLLDQVVSSATNFLPGLFAAKTLTTSNFGVFALVQVAYILALSMGRAAFTEVALLGDGGAEARLAAVDSMALASCTVGAAAAVGLVASGATPTVAVLAAVAGVVAMLVQDALRLGAIGAGRPGQALLSDALWFFTTTVGLGLVAVHALPRDSWTLAAVWGLGAAVGAAAGAVALDWRGPSGHRALSFARGNRRQSGSFLGDWAIKTGAVQVATYGVGLVGGIATVAGIRAAQLLLGPMNILFAGISLALMPRAVHLRDSQVQDLPRVMLRASLLLGVASTAVGAILAVIPADVLRIVVGDQAEGLSRFALPLALTLAASGLITGSNIGLRSLAAGRSLIGARVVTSVLTVAGGLAGYAVTRDALGTLWGLAAGALLGAPLWDFLLRRAARDFAAA